MRIIKHNVVLFSRSNSQIGNWEQQENGRSPSMGGRSPESQWSDRASLQHQDSLESRRSEPARPSKNVTAAANKVAANSEEDELLQIKRRQWDESTAKRIHVVVRARPLNIREIKADARVTT